MLLRLRAEVGVVLEHLERLAVEVAPHVEALVDEGSGEPEAWDMAAFANMLAAFYNGVENSLVRIETLLGDPPSRKDGWHAELLDRAGQPSPARPAVFDEALVARLHAYMRLRHVIRHVYPFQLDWMRMRPAVEDLVPAIREVVRQISLFLDAINGSPA